MFLFKRYCLTTNRITSIRDKSIVYFRLFYLLYLVLKRVTLISGNKLKPIVMLYRRHTTFFKTDLIGLFLMPIFTIHNIRLSIHNSALNCPLTPSTNIPIETYLNNSQNRISRQSRKRLSEHFAKTIIDTIAKINIGNYNN